MSGNDIAMSGGVRCGRCPLSPASSVRWLPLVAVLFPCRCQWFGCVIGGGSIPFQVRAVVAMVKFSHLTNFVLNKKLGCIIQNCSLGGCVPRWLCGVSLLLFPCRVIVFHRSGSMGVSVVFPCFYSLAG